MNAERNVTHRMTRTARRDIAGNVLTEGEAPVPFTEHEWEVCCACGNVYRAPTELAVSAAYLAHLPKPPVRA